MYDFKCVCKTNKHNFSDNSFLTKIWTLDDGLEKCRKFYYKSIEKPYPGPIRCVCYDNGIRCPFYALFMADPKMKRSKMVEAFNKCQRVYVSSIKTPEERFQMENEEFLQAIKSEQLAPGKKFRNIFSSPMQLLKRKK